MQATESSSSERRAKLLPDRQAVPFGDTELLRAMPDDPGITFDLSQTNLGRSPKHLSAVPESSMGESALQAAGPVPRRLLGSGGYGEVWEAVEPVLGRVIAIKRIRSDALEQLADDPRELGYLRNLFYREALTTARLEHPNIVPVHQFLRDAGGNPILAMKRVRGTVWERLIVEDFHTLPIHDFFARHLNILIGVTQAVAFAHARGVIHRDLKPAQVMVGEYGEVLLMDWGLAMVFDTARFQDDDTQTHDLPMPFTRETASNPSGTSAWMAPEQTEYTTERLGPHTDLFLIGGMLYFLLTLTSPHRARQKAAAFEEARNCKIPHPRAATPEGRFVPEELALLAMRCLSPEPAHRPGEATEIITSLQDYLTGASKRRESQAIVAEAATALAGASDYRALGELVAKLGNARALWPENPRVEAVRDQVVSRYSELALSLGDLVLAQVQADRLAEGDVRRDLHARIGEATSLQRRRNRQRRAAIFSVAILLALLAAGAIRVSFKQHAARLEILAANEALRNQRDQGNDLLSFVLRDLGERLEPTGQLDLLRDVALRSRIYYDHLPADSDSPAALRNRALSFRQIGDVFAAENKLTEADDAYRLGAELLASYPEAEGITDGALVDRLEFDLRRAELMTQRGQWDAFEELIGAAEKDIRHLRERYSEDPGLREILARALVIRSRAFPARGTANELVMMAKEASATIQPLTLNPSPSPRILRTAADVSRALAEARRIQGDFATARTAYLEERDLWRRALDISPRDAVALQGLADACDGLGTTEFDLGDYPAALDAFNMRLKLCESLSQRDPLNGVWKGNFAWAYNSVAFIHHWRGEFDEALAAYTTGDAMLAELMAQAPENTLLRSRRVTTLNNIGSVLGFQGRPSAAMPCFELMRDLLEGLLAVDPDNAEWRRLLAINHGKLGITHELFGRHEEAELEYRKRLAITAALSQSDPTNMSLLESLHGAHIHLALILDKLGRKAEADVEFVNADKEMKTLLAAVPAESPAALRIEANATSRELSRLRGEGCVPEAASKFNHLADIHRRLRESSPDDLSDRLRDIGAHLTELQMAANDGEDIRRRLPLVRQLRAEAESLIKTNPRHRGLQTQRADMLVLEARLLANLGENMRAEEQRTAALLAYAEIALTEDPDSQINLGRMLALMGNPEEARAIVDNLVSLGYSAGRARKIIVEDGEQ